MSLSQLHYFVAVAEEQHLSRAAKKLHISQPPLTRQIRALEEELGAPLFERTPRGMRLLPSGSRLLPHARHILASVERAKSALQDDTGVHMERSPRAERLSRDRPTFAREKAASTGACQLQPLETRS